MKEQNLVSVSSCEDIKRLEKPNHVFAEVLEQTAIDQFVSAMECQFVVQGALMPDAHAGYSLPIGAVIATDGIILPSY